MLLSTMILSLHLGSVTACLVLASRSSTHSQPPTDTNHTARSQQMTQTSRRWEICQIRAVKHDNLQEDAQCQQVDSVLIAGIDGLLQSSRYGECGKVLYQIQVG